jgi:alkylation response protein AidB-like acyl-CoA dehydrogenase
MDTRQLILDTAERIFADHVDKAVRDRAESAELPAALWRVLDESGLTSLADAGAETGLADAYAVLRAAGRHAVPGPLAETLLARRLWTEAGGVVPEGLVTLAFADRDGRAADVPWARASTHVVVVVPSEAGTAKLALANVRDLDIQSGANMAGEARDDTAFRGNASTAAKRSYAEIEALAALTRAVMMAGALETALRFAVGYSLERKQFGKTISSFQAIQHQLAVLAGDVAAAGRAADGAVERLEHAATGDALVLDVAVAKSRIGEAATRGAEIAHQVHGAIGFTHEHELHQFTRRLWAWRDEHGNEAVWQMRLGRAVASRGADAAWAFVASF